ncbi:hypothetical protein CTAYLR_008443 [Chrysophaeum taylorii]|uniref:SET domain-containing protein n=1 Tax=Chrysophaeum taylorii TaxID=2483200 RepID=A0AAD7ULR5_9STRA|nr:hypothetical protein CTAYLR_008443 [Chrysophaeum taylorii]
MGPWQEKRGAKVASKKKTKKRRTIGWLLDDEGEVGGWPIEGLCLVVADGRSRPAWKCRGRSRWVLVYGERTEARELSSNERLCALPEDVELCRRLQSEWSGATPAQRDCVLAGLDEMEARRRAPPSFVALVSELRKRALDNTCLELGPTASIGREFAPNLFSPVPGDSAHVLWDKTKWYEAIVLEASNQLLVRYVEDGEKDSVEWPEPNGEAFLAAPPLAAKRGPRRRCSPKSPPQLGRDWRPFLAKERDGSFELPWHKLPEAFSSSSSSSFLLAPAALESSESSSASTGSTTTTTAVLPPDHHLRARRAFVEAVCFEEARHHHKNNSDGRRRLEAALERCCARLRALARPLSALVEDFASEPRQDWVFGLPRGDDDWPFDFVKEDEAPIPALFEFADRLSDALNALGAVPDEDAASRAASRARAALSPAPDDIDVDALRVASSRVARLWRRDEACPIGPAKIWASTAPCFATLPRSNVREPHRSWIQRARGAAKAHLKRREEEDEDDDLCCEKKKYRPPGAAARAALCGDRGRLAMETLAPEVARSLAGGLGADFSRRVEVITCREGLLAGERGVVAIADVEKRAAIPYAGVVVTDDEIGQLVWRRPRDTARWLMYRYEFAPQISLLPYLACPDFAPAPFINCARGPHPNEAAAWSALGALRDDPRPWRGWGSEHVGLRIRRTVLGDDGAPSGVADGTVVAWLDARESDFRDDDGRPAALWRVKYDPESALCGDDEDLELRQLLASAKAPPLERSSSDKANCHFAEITGDQNAVIGVYVVATRKIQAGEPLLVAYGREFWDGWIQRHARLDDLERCADDLVSAAADLLLVLETTPPPRRHDLWRHLVGIPFEATRALRGERRRKAVVSALVVERCRQTTTLSLRKGDRVEGFWRGAAPSFPATVKKVAPTGDLVDLEYDDGGVELALPLTMVAPKRPPHYWRALPALPRGTWVRKFLLASFDDDHLHHDHHLDDDEEEEEEQNAPTTRKNRRRRLRRRRDEGVVVDVDDDGLLDVLGDDGVLETNQDPQDWEPLFVCRFADDDEQRVMGLEQLRHLSPRFIDHPPPHTFVDPIPPAAHPKVDIAMLLREAGLPALREEVAALQEEALAAAALAAETQKPADEEPEQQPPPKKQPPKPPPPQRRDPDDAIGWGDRALACAPYLLPLSDVLPFGKYVLTDFPVIAVALVGPFAPLLAILNAVPFGGFLVFIAISTQTRNANLSRFVRFNMQQAIILDIALIFPQLIGSLGNAVKIQLPPALLEPASTTVFFAVSISILYAIFSNCNGNTPNNIPVVSEAADRSIGPF